MAAKPEVLITSLHIDLHWLNVPERVIYKLSVMVYHCLHGIAPKYLSELCTLVA